MLKKIKQSLLSPFNRSTCIDPSFLIIGCQKCGTTSLYNYLIQHPQVTRATRKEIHFFDLNYEKGYDWYRNHFPAPERGAGGGRPIAGEATPYYILHPHAPSRVKRTLPDARIILLLRDPVERAFSHYQHHVKFDIEPLAFDAAVKAEPERLDGEWERMLADPGYDSYNLQMFSYLTRGVYDAQVERWLEFFPREQVLVIQSEAFFDNPAAVFSETLTFLGLPDHRLERYKTFNPGKGASIPEATRRYLVDYFRPHNERLFALIGKDYSWQA